MSQLVFQQIAYHATEQRQISVQDHVSFKVNYQFVMAFMHGGLVKIYELLYHLGKVNRTAIKAKGPRFRLSEIERRVQQVQKPIQVFDCSATESRQCSLGSLHKAASSVPRIEVTGLF